jgi:hypothetical protein
MTLLLTVKWWQFSNTVCLARVSTAEIHVEIDHTSLLGVELCSSKTLVEMGGPSWA